MICGILFLFSGIMIAAGVVEGLVKKYRITDKKKIKTYKLIGFIIGLLVFPITGVFLILMMPCMIAMMIYYFKRELFG